MKSILKYKVTSRQTFKRRVNKLLQEHTQNVEKNEIVSLLKEPADNKELRSELCNVIPLLNEEISQVDNNLLLSNELRNWAIKHNITHSALNDLLLILNNSNLCRIKKDARTLLQTPRKVKTVIVPPGEYWHFGLDTALEFILKDTCQDIAMISLDFNIDGLPISSSSKGQLWPILCSLNCIYTQPFAVGVYYGHAKPNSAEEFFRNFIEELSILLENGIAIQDKTIDIKVRNFICDTPARAFIKGIKGHNGYFACERCTVEGEYSSKRHHMSFPQISLALRTNESFRKREQEEHHTKTSPLEALPIDMVTNFPLDYMHLICLGVMKKLLLYWTKGGSTNSVKLQSKDQINISNRLLNAGNTIPREFNRAVRPLDVISFWKATEFRTFLLYTGPVALKGILRENVYLHFMLLHCAMRICTCQDLIKYSNVARQLLKSFVQKFSGIYGADCISYNVHNLIHIADDVERWGVLDNFSAFPYENELQHIKRLVRSGKKPLQQIAHRTSEVLSNVAGGSRLDNHRSGNCKGMKSEVKFKNFSISTKDNDKWFITKNDYVVSMKNATMLNGEPAIYGSRLRDTADFFKIPIKSSFLKIFKSCNMEENPPEFWKICEIHGKAFHISSGAHENIFVSLPH